MTDPLLSALGVPDQRSVTDLARLMGINDARLAPALLAKSAPLRRTLGYAADMLRGKDLGAAAEHDRGCYARAAALVERLDEGDVYSVSELAAHMALWGMQTADDEIVKLHMAGAPAVFAERGWTGVRLWAREVCK